jgi:hypothetical protein
MAHPQASWLFDLALWRISFHDESVFRAGREQAGSYTGRMAESSDPCDPN